MTRIYRHTIADAPGAARPLLEGFVPFSPTGKPLNLHAQMAHSPLVLAAAAKAGRVSDATWQQAADSGWSSEQLTEAFGYLALTVFTAYFVNYAQTPTDLPGEPAPAAAGVAGSGAAVGGRG